MGVIIHLPRKQTYEKPPIKMIGDLYSLIRGLGTDLYLIKNYTFEGEGSELARGRVADKPLKDLTQEENEACVVAKYLLDSKLERVTKDYIAAESDEPISYFSDEEGFASIVIKSDYGYLSFGWQDGTKTSSSKNELMVTLLAYAFGYVNSESRDETAVMILYRYLPYAGHMGAFSPTTLDIAICESLGEIPTNRPPRHRHSMTMVN